MDTEPIVIDFHLLGQHDQMNHGHDQGGSDDSDFKKSWTGKTPPGFAKDIDLPSGDTLKNVGKGLAAVGVAAGLIYLVYKANPSSLAASTLVTSATKTKTKAITHTIKANDGKILKVVDHTGSLSERHVGLLTKSLKDIYDLHPLDGKTPTIEVHNQHKLFPEAFAFVKNEEGTRTIFINKKTFLDHLTKGDLGTTMQAGIEKNSFEDAVPKDAWQKWFTEGFYGDEEKSIRHVVFHEYGHVVDFDNIHKAAKLDTYSDDFDSDKLGEYASKHSEKFFEASRNIKGMTLDKILDMDEDQTLKLMDRKIAKNGQSTYGMVNDLEMYAETFADHYETLGQSKNKATQIMASEPLFGWKQFNEDGTVKASSKNVTVDPILVEFHLLGQHEQQNHAGGHSRASHSGLTSDHKALIKKIAIAAGVAAVAGVGIYAGQNIIARKAAEKLAAEAADKAAQDAVMILLKETQRKASHKAITEAAERSGKEAADKVARRLAYEEGRKQAAEESRKRFEERMANQNIIKALEEAGKKADKGALGREGMTRWETIDGHHDINDALRDGTEPNPTIARAIRGMDSAFATTTLETKGATFSRGLRDPQFSLPNGVKVDVTGLKAGDIIQDRGFQSITGDITQAEYHALAGYPKAGAKEVSQAVLMEVRTQQGTKVLYEPNINAFTLNRDTPMRIVEVIPDQKSQLTKSPITRVIVEVIE